jgi:hypothetical protein
VKKAHAAPSPTIWRKHARRLSADKLKEGAMSKKTEEIPELKGDEEAVILFTGKTDEGKDFYAYIKLTTQKLGEFYLAQEREAPINLASLGQILASGYGEKPPLDVQNSIKEEFGDIFQDLKD